jgi:hypothetical protein
LKQFVLRTLAVVIGLGWAALSQAGTILSFSALQVAVTQPHTCVATALTDTEADVYCELGPDRRHYNLTYRAPLAWVRANFTQTETTPVEVWFSGGNPAVPQMTKNQ